MASLRLTPNQINVCIVPSRNMLQAPSRISLLEVLARRRSCGVRNPRIGPKRPVKIGRTAHQHRQPAGEHPSLRGSALNRGRLDLR